MLAHTIIAGYLRCWSYSAAVPLPPARSIRRSRGRPHTGYRFETRQAQDKDKQNLVVLAFSGGGTRAAAFSYGVLEFLRKTEIVGPKDTARLLDEVDVITGVSGGSFTALAYGLYGDKLFTDYEQRFLKRDVQGEIVSRSFSPANWGKLGSTAWGRSELASEQMTSNTRWLKTKREPVEMSVADARISGPLPRSRSPKVALLNRISSYNSDASSDRPQAVDPSFPQLAGLNERRRFRPVRRVSRSAARSR